MEERFFYHSFPRPRKGETPEHILQKGMSILSLINSYGIVLAPEVVRWKQPLQEGGVRELEQLQKRICFTELSESELPAHAERFGPFALQFDLDTVRHLGAVPVSYIPQVLVGDTPSAVGATLVAELFDARGTMDQLQQLRDGLNQLEALKAEGTPIAPGCAFDLVNVDRAGTPVKKYHVSVAAVRDVVEYLSFQNAPFSLMRGVLNAMLSLFYPADDQVNDKVLGYYRQREWRIVSGVEVNGVSVSSSLTPEQSRRVSNIDVSFWERMLSIRFPLSHAKTFRRIDEAEILSGLGGRKLLDLVKAVIVPQRAGNECSEMFRGSRQSKNSLGM